MEQSPAGGGGQSPAPGPLPHSHTLTHLSAHCPAPWRPKACTGLQALLFCSAVFPSLGSEMPPVSQPEEGVEADPGRICFTHLEDPARAWQLRSLCIPRALSCPPGNPPPPYPNPGALGSQAAQAAAGLGPGLCQAVLKDPSLETCPDQELLCPAWGLELGLAAPTLHLSQAY